MDFTNRSADAGDCSHACEGADQGDEPHGLRHTAQWVSGFLWLCDRSGDLETLVPMGVESVQSVENGDRAGRSKGAAPDTTAASAGGVGGAGGHWLDFVDESCRKKTREIWQRCERAHIPFEGLLQLHRENAPPRCYFTRMLPYSLSSQARSEWGWIGVALDAERLGHGVRSWDKSVERIGLLELAAKATQDVLWDWNLRTQQLWWGENFYSRFGYSREETEADIRSWKTRIHPEDLERVACGIQKCINEGEEHWEDQYRFRMSSGEYAVIHDRGYIQRGTDGQPERMVGAMIDVTKENEARDEILRLNRELEQEISRRNIEIASATTALEAFSYSVSHDLRAPVRHIIGFVELLKRTNEERLNDEGRRYVALIIESGERMAGLIDALLSLSRLGRREMHVTQINLGEMIEGIQKDFSVELANREIKWTIHPLPNPWGDRVLIRQIFVNLIDNAVKYTRNRKSASIEIGASDNGNEWEFFVKDNGVGFDMKYSEKLFHVFQRLHSEKDFDGYGVGLANVKRIVSIHGGRVWADSAVDKGTTLFFTLPKSTPLIDRATSVRNQPQA